VDRQSEFSRDPGEPYETCSNELAVVLIASGDCCVERAIQTQRSHPNQVQRAEGEQQ